MLLVVLVVLQLKTKQRSVVMQKDSKRRTFSKEVQHLQPRWFFSLREQHMSPNPPPDAEKTYPSCQIRSDKVGIFISFQIYSIHRGNSESLWNLHFL